MIDFNEYILRLMPRTLTQIDRDKDSKTFGSCDRNYWHYKIRDFSSGILQQTALTLAICAKVNFVGNIYYNNKNIIEWSNGILSYTCRIQLKDGSFNEYYPNEHGFPPTVFNLFAMCETYKVLDCNNSAVIIAIRKAADYVSRHVEQKAFNQDCAALAGLYSTYKLLGETKYLKAAQEKKQHLIQNFNYEGWMPEQGGADIGYLSVSLDMLAEYYDQSGDNDILPLIEKILIFISGFVHPNGTIGGEYGSRNTTYFMPAGLIIMATHGNSIAYSIAMKIYDGIKAPNHFMYAVDERYLCHYVLHSFARAILHYQKISTVIKVKLPCEQTDVNLYYPQAKIGIVSNHNYYAIIGLNKGGIVKIYDKRQGASTEIFADCGFRAYLSGEIGVTNWLDDGYTVYSEDGSFSVEGEINKTKQNLQTPFKHFALRVAAFFMGGKVNQLSKRILLYNDAHIKIHFSRKINCDDSTITIYDNLDSTDNTVTYKHACTQSMRLVASGKFFSTSDLIEQNGSEYTTPSLSLKTSLVFNDDNKVIINVEEK